MVSNVKKRLYLLCVYLGALFLVAGTVLHYLQHFSGTIFLLPGTAESLVFCSADGAVRLGAAQRGVPPEMLLFVNPRSVEALRADQSYDSAVMPFSLRLDSVDVLKEREPREVLHIEGPGVKRREVVRPGTRLTLGADSLEMNSIGPWEGLVRDPRGQAMAAIEVPGGSTPRAFLESGRVYTLQPDLAVCFLWHASEAEARKAFVPELSGVPGARWGVRDGQAIQWFENFFPGTGAVLLDGTRVTMSRFSREEGTIMLAFERSAGREMKVVKANGPEGNAPVVYEDPAATGRVLYLHSWREDRAIGRLLSRGAPAKEIELGIGSGGAPVVLRQIMQQALAVPAGTVRAAQIRIGETSLVLREGLAETVGEYRLRYQMEALPPDARYHISTLDSGGASLAEHTLESGETLRAGVWIFKLSEENPFAPRGVALTAERRSSGIGEMLGLGLLVLGSFGLVLVRVA